MSFSKDVLRLDPVKECERITLFLRKTILAEFRRRGAIVGISGGIDSATVLALIVKAIGPGRVVPLFIPERDTSPVSHSLALEVAHTYGLEPLVEDITGILDSMGCYGCRDTAVRSVFPDYDPARDRVKIVLPADLLNKSSLNVYSLVRIGSSNEERRILPTNAYLEIVAASNMKQRTRMLKLYHHAERHNFAVVGTANKNEYAQGFFVKYGDGGADLQPIAHLYKTQVYQLARYLGVPHEVINRTPTTDTYSAECSQEEFYFRVPFHLLDLTWYGLEHQIPPDIIAQELGLSAEQVERICGDLVQKARSTEYLRSGIMALKPVDYS